MQNVRDKLAFRQTHTNTQTYHHLAQYVFVRARQPQEQVHSDATEWVRSIETERYITTVATIQNDFISTVWWMTFVIERRIYDAMSIFQYLFAHCWIWYWYLILGKHTKIQITKIKTNQKMFLSRETNWMHPLEPWVRLRMCTLHMSKVTCVCVFCDAQPCTPYTQTNVHTRICISTSTLCVRARTHHTQPCPNVLCVIFFFFFYFLLCVWKYAHRKISVYINKTHCRTNNNNNKQNPCPAIFR